MAASLFSPADRITYPIFSKPENVDLVLINKSQPESQNFRNIVDSGILKQHGGDIDDLLKLLPELSVGDEFMNVKSGLTFTITPENIKKPFEFRDKSKKQFLSFTTINRNYNLKVKSPIFGDEVFIIKLFKPKTKNKTSDDFGVNIEMLKEDYCHFGKSIPHILYYGKIMFHNKSINNPQPFYRQELDPVKDKVKNIHECDYFITKIYKQDFDKLSLANKISVIISFTDLVIECNKNNLLHTDIKHQNFGYDDDYNIVCIDYKEVTFQKIYTLETRGKFKYIYSTYFPLYLHEKPFNYDRLKINWPYDDDNLHELDKFFVAGLIEILQFMFFPLWEVNINDLLLWSTGKGNIQSTKEYIKRSLAELKSSISQTDPHLKIIYELIEKMSSYEYKKIPTIEEIKVTFVEILRNVSDRLNRIYMSVFLTEKPTNFTDKVSAYNKYAAEWRAQGYWAPETTVDEISAYYDTYYQNLLQISNLYYETLKKIQDEKSAIANILEYERTTTRIKKLEPEPDNTRKFRTMNIIKELYADILKTSKYKFVRPQIASDTGLTERIVFSDKITKSLYLARTTTIHVLNIDVNDLTEMLLKGNFKNVAILNLANAYGAGGGVKEGDLAQEEEIYRRTNIHSKLGGGPYDRPMDFENGEVFFTPNVKITTNKLYGDYKSDYTFNVISAAATRLQRGEKMTEKAIRGLELTIENIFVVAINKGIRILILGALGCGAFYNDPNVVSEIYKKFIIKYKTRFDLIFFSILVVLERDRQNLTIFKKLEKV